jgi:hypothetical protein
LPKMHILHIYCILFAYCLHIILHIILHTSLHIVHIVLHIASIFFCILFCVFCIFSYMHIVHIQHIAICILCILCIFTMKNILIEFFIVYCHYCLVPYPRALLFTYHHLQPSPQLADLSQNAQGKLADSHSMAKGIVPFASTGTRGMRPSIEETGITYKTCACS